MFGTSQPPAAAPASIALAPAAMPLGGGAAADAGANGGGTPTYSRYASLYAATNGMSSLSLDGWGGAPAAADPYAASSIFAPSGLAAEPAGGLAAAGQGLGLGSGAGSAAALAQSGSPTGSGSLNQVRRAPHRARARAVPDLRPIRIATPARAAATAVHYQPSDPQPPCAPSPTALASPPRMTCAPSL